MFRKAINFVMKWICAVIAIWSMAMVLLHTGMAFEIIKEAAVLNLLGGAPTVNAAELAPGAKNMFIAEAGTFFLLLVFAMKKFGNISAAARAANPASVKSKQARQARQPQPEVSDAAEEDVSVEVRG